MPWTPGWAIVLATLCACAAVASLATSEPGARSATVLADMGGELLDGEACDLDGDLKDEVIYAHRWDDPRPFIGHWETSAEVVDTGPTNDLATQDRTMRSLLGESWGEVVVFEMPTGAIRWRATLPGAPMEVGCIALPDRTLVFATSRLSQLQRGATSLYTSSGMFHGGTLHLEGGGRAAIAQDVNLDGFADLVLAIPGGSTVDVEIEGSRVEVLDGSLLPMLQAAYVPAVHPVRLWSEPLDGWPAAIDPIQVALQDGNPVVLTLDDFGRLKALEGGNGTLRWEWKDPWERAASFAILPGADDGSAAVVIGGSSHLFEVSLSDGEGGWRVIHGDWLATQAHAWANGVFASVRDRTVGLTHDGRWEWERSVDRTHGGRPWSIVSGDLDPAPGIECAALYSVGDGAMLYAPADVVLVSCNTGAHLTSVPIPASALRLLSLNVDGEGANELVIGDSFGRLILI